MIPVVPHNEEPSDGWYRTPEGQVCWQGTYTPKETAAMVDFKSVNLPVDRTLADARKEAERESEVFELPFEPLCETVLKRAYRYWTLTNER